MRHFKVTVGRKFYAFLAISFAIFTVNHIIQGEYVWAVLTGLLAAYDTHGFFTDKEVDLIDFKYDVSVTKK